MVPTDRARQILIGLFGRLKTGISFAQMAQELSRQGVDPEGEYAIHPGGHPHMIVWMGMSLEFKEAVLDLLSSGTITLKLSSPLVYLLDGGLPAMPVARGARAKSDRWLPVVVEYHGN